MNPADQKSSSNFTAARPFKFGLVFAVVTLLHWLAQIPRVDTRNWDEFDWNKHILGSNYELTWLLAVLAAYSFTRAGILLAAQPLDFGRQGGGAMNASPSMPQVPAAAPRPFEPVVFWIAVIAATLAAFFGVVCLYDATQSTSSGERSSLGHLATMIVEIPAGLFVFVLAFTQRRLRRVALVVFGLLLLALPFQIGSELQQQRVKQRRETEEIVLRRTRDVLDEKPK